jgi:MFS family permease
VELVRGNRNYRFLWLGQLISFLGDWFNTIAMYVIVERLTGSPFALGMVFITKMLPFALASPIGGILADRFNRRRLMIATDLLRALVVLGFLTIDTVEEIPLLYVLAAIQVAISSAFSPAQGASIPNVVSERELVTANTLMAATWSTILAIGAALGGFATEWLGVKTVFLIDSATYLVSAVFIYLAVIPQETDSTERGPILKEAHRDLVDGVRHLLDHPAVARIATAKASWAIGGSGMVFMLTLLGTEMMPAATAIGIGIFFSMRGIGTGIGPILARRWFTDETKWGFVLGACITFSGIFYMLVGIVPWVYLVPVALLVLIAHTSSGTNWVLSNVLLQKRTVDRFRGRVFAAEWVLVTLVNSISIVVASLLLETPYVSLRQAFLLFAGLQMIAGILWIAAVVPGERRLARASVAA